MTNPNTSHNHTALDIARAITVIRRDTGFLCLSLPRVLLAPDILTAIRSGLESLNGLTQLRLDQNTQQIALRFDQQKMSTSQVAHHLFSLLETLDISAVTTAADRTTSSVTVSSAVTSKFKPLLKGALTETAAINFFNDLTAFYLVKVHWEQITKRWIKQPSLYTNAWLTTFYLIFLLVRYRKKFVNKPASTPSQT